MPAECEAFTALWPQADKDVGFFQAKGISEDLMAETVRHFATPFKRGMHYGFFGGRAYMLTPTYLAKYGQMSLSRHLTYMNVLLDLEQRYGPHIPDCEFVISTTDIPTQNPLPQSEPNPSRTLQQQQQQRKQRSLEAAGSSQQPQQPQQRQQQRSPRAAKAAALHTHALTHPFGPPGIPNGTYPILRSCKSAAFPDILIPSHDFYQLRYDTTVLRAVANLTAAGEMPGWGRRLPAAYGRYDLRVARSRHAADRTTYRYGTGDMRICSGAGETRCFVRRHLWGIAEKANRSVVDISHVPAASDHHLIDLHTPRHLALAMAREDLSARRHARRSHAAAAHNHGGSRIHSSSSSRSGGTHDGIHNADADIGGTQPHHAHSAAPYPTSSLAWVSSVSSGSAAADGEGDALLSDAAHEAYLLQQAAVVGGVSSSSSSSSSGVAGASGDEEAAAGSSGFFAPGEVEQLRAAPHLPAYLRAAAQHQLLVHVDGAGCSSSLERLLPLGGVVLREESGYFSYFQQAIKPDQHFRRWWIHDPEDLYSQAAWAETHPHEAHEIAAAGAAFARDMLGARGRACYWLAVLKRLATAFTYEPKLADHPRALLLARYRDEQVLRMRPGPGQRPLWGQPFEP
ncbi:hypothetical protein HYH02_008830 [Chlamydomonas schloesseri]|uniref:Glycosyl transferase CAP10 domain-containing protein n=1 Tax=Chlamydomonas schloesseri TaxID=2026947 RepID=A0A835WDV0_9CHLO|nr:hypothetical protein HYH02_008830 [Chlamydomonas schloesseri]|eukprot:KAG2445365.1 hypothetical protein HYH02_008830 [Chlamydomonas schloesseri]